jgi:hypothetical protein
VTRAHTCLCVNVLAVGAGRIANTKSFASATASRISSAGAYVCMCDYRSQREALLMLSGLQAKHALERASKAEQLASDARQLASAKEQVSLS